jgi:hypothetical protein
MSSADNSALAAVASEAAPTANATTVEGPVSAVPVADAVQDNAGRAKEAQIGLAASEDVTATASGAARKICCICGTESAKYKCARCAQPL